MFRRNGGCQHDLSIVGLLAPGDEVRLEVGDIADHRIGNLLQEFARGLVLVMPPDRLRREAGDAQRPTPDVVDVLTPRRPLARFRRRFEGEQDVRYVGALEPEQLLAQPPGPRHVLDDQAVVRLGQLGMVAAVDRPVGRLDVVVRVVIAVPGRAVADKGCEQAGRNSARPDHAAQEVEVAIPHGLQDRVVQSPGRSGTRIVPTPPRASSRRLPARPPGRRRPA